MTVQFKVEFSVERCVGEEIEKKQCYSLLIAKNVFKALGVGPFTTQVIGLSPLVAKLIQMIISFEDETNFVRLVTSTDNDFGDENPSLTFSVIYFVIQFVIHIFVIDTCHQYQLSHEQTLLKCFSLSVNYTAIEEQELSNIKIILKQGINVPV